MIRKQMKEMDAEKDYLGDKLVVPKLTLIDSPWMQAEIERVLSKKQSSDVEMTDDSYSKVVSEPKQKSVQAYQNSIDKAAINLETQQNA